MWLGAIEFDVLLGEVHSRKAKRGVVRPLIAEIRRKFGVSVAETGHVDLWRRCSIGASVTSSTGHHSVEVLDELERFVAARPEIELLAARRRLFNIDDE